MCSWPFVGSPETSKNRVLCVAPKRQYTSNDDHGLFIARCPHILQDMPPVLQTVIHPPCPTEHLTARGGGHNLPWQEALECHCLFFLLWMCPDSFILRNYDKYWYVFSFRGPYTSLHSKIKIVMIYYPLVVL